MTEETTTQTFEAGIRWQQFDRNDRIVGKEKFFSGKTAVEACVKRDRFCAKLEKKDNFYQFTAWLNA